MSIIKNDINWNKFFRIIYIVAAIIVIVIIWKPAKSSGIDKYTRLKIDDVDKLASEEYINKFVNKVYDKDVEYLYSKLKNSYISYNKIDEQKFINLFNSEFNVRNLSVSKVQKLQYNNTVVYRASLSNGSKLNIIEEYGKKWKYTFDDFYNFKITNFDKKYNGVNFIIDSVYQTFDSVELTCYIENMTNKDIDIHMEREDSVILALDKKQTVELSNAQIDRSLSKINSKAFSSRTFKFNLGFEKQAAIEKIIFTNLEINGEKGTLEINLNFN